ncbi:OmpA family protein [uncultured Desulfobacter sp.]|uniref:OmpA/MotB family protein n=1 Tax=uncultured Desulfobacter sp. TaxID=240139 RepID=UPI002AAA7FBB|nr:OmpA family protein [uncultured Desulfobacter sp.]
MGTFYLTLTFPGRMIFVLIPLYLVLFYYTGIANGAYQPPGSDPEQYSIAELEGILGDYRTQLNILNDQLHDTQKDLDWLVVKINGISDSGRYVPGVLHESVGLKEKKISQLKAQRKYLDEVIASYQKIYETKKKLGHEKTQITVSSISDMNDSVKVLDKSNMTANLGGIEQAVKNAGLEDWVEVLEGDGSCAKINNSLPILFSSGSAALAKEYKSFLKKLALLLKPYDVKVYVNGYADPDPIHTKQYPSNLELGASRAANVVHEMVRNGLKPDIFKIGSTGEYRFAAKMQSSKKTFQRRVQVTVVFSG